MTKCDFAEGIFILGFVIISLTVAVAFSEKFNTDITRRVAVRECRTESP